MANPARAINCKSNHETKLSIANSMDELKSYREVVNHFKQESRKINLLSGNGFSIDCDRNGFSSRIEVTVFDRFRPYRD